MSGVILVRHNRDNISAITYLVKSYPSVVVAVVVPTFNYVVITCNYVVTTCNYVITSDLETHEPLYQILAKIAELYQHGGHGLDKDPLK